MNDEDQRRAETGTMRFGDDWPGVFIRGDNAVFYGMQLTSLLDMIESAAKRSMDAGSPSPVDLLSLSFAAMMLRGLARNLAACDARDNPTIVNELRPFDECVARRDDVTE